MQEFGLSNPGEFQFEPDQGLAGEFQDFLRKGLLNNKIYLATG